EESRPALDRDSGLLQHRLEHFLRDFRLEVVAKAVAWLDACPPHPLCVAHADEELVGDTADDFMTARSYVGLRNPAGHRSADPSRRLEQHDGVARARRCYRGGHPSRGRCENHDAGLDALNHTLPDAACGLIAYPYLDPHHRRRR